MGLKFAFELDNYSVKRYSAISLMPRTENSQFDDLKCISTNLGKSHLLSSDGLNLPMEQICAGCRREGTCRNVCTVVTDCHSFQQHPLVC